MNTTTTTTPAERDSAEAEGRVRALAHELRIAVRILNREVSDLVLVDSGPAPAWTDFDRLYLNTSELPSDVRTPEAVAVFVGAALHELGHTLFSPRPGSDLFDRLAAAERLGTARGILGTLNLVEDQRQERAIIGRFSPTRGYLSALVVDLILSGGNAGTSWPLVCGRTWLAESARAKSRAAWSAEFGEESAADIARLVGAFQSLSDPAEADATEGVAVVSELHALLSGANVPADSCGADAGMRGGESVPTPEGGPETAADADAALSEDEGETEGETEGSGAEGDSAEGDSAEGDSGEGDSEGEGEEDGADGLAAGTSGEESSETDSGAGDSGETEGDSAEGDSEGSGAEGETEGDSPEGETLGNGTGTGDAPASATLGEDLAESVADALADAVAEVLSAEDVREELNEYRDAANVGNAPAGDLPERATDRGYRGAMSDEVARVADDLAEVLGDLRNESESAWVRGTDRGRINPSRLFNPSGVIDPLSLFDQYAPDSLDATSVEVVVLVDVSGSMNGSEGQLSEAVHAIHTAADRAEVALTVLAFGAETRTLIAEGERPAGVRSILCRDDYTQPLGAILAAADILRTSDASHRVALILSDGAWSYSERAEAESTIAAMNASGVETVSAFYGRGLRNNTPEDTRQLAESYGHGAGTFAPMDNLGTLVAVFGEVVARGMADAMR